MFLKSAYIIMLSVVLFTFVSCSEIGGRMPHESTESVIAIGDKKYQVISSLKQWRYDFDVHEMGNGESGNNSTTMIFIKFKPVSPWHPIHKDWLGSSYEFVFTDDLLSKINWRSENGDFIQSNIDQLYLYNPEGK